mmetsp:Transcript_89702/g.158758  ORF Transcript_89702/g.158758 Transcript_89702/m.158758 type:complete len:254 (+) Transcript_89702:50-811(+)
MGFLLSLFLAALRCPVSVAAVERWAPPEAFLKPETWALRVGGSCTWNEACAKHGDEWRTIAGGLYQAPNKSECASENDLLSGGVEVGTLYWWVPPSTPCSRTSSGLAMRHGSWCYDTNGNGDLDPDDLCACLVDRVEDQGLEGVNWAFEVSGCEEGPVVGSQIGTEWGGSTTLHAGGIVGLQFGFQDPSHFLYISGAAGLQWALPDSCIREVVASHAFCHTGTSGARRVSAGEDKGPSGEFNEGASDRLRDDF